MSNHHERGPRNESSCGIIEAAQYAGRLESVRVQIPLAKVALESLKSAVTQLESIISVVTITPEEESARQKSILAAKKALNVAEPLAKETLNALAGPMNELLETHTAESTVQALAHDTQPLFDSFSQLMQRAEVAAKAYIDEGDEE